jgi:hypothetical protein
MYGSNYIHDAVDYEDAVLMMMMMMAIMAK